jgi:CRISPR-associated protein Cas2
MINNDRINQYRIMWLFVTFDLPVGTKDEIKAATGFRKNLLEHGFVMFQFSIYTRHCASKEHAELYLRRIRLFLPPKGKISILMFTDKQFGMIETYYGTAISGPPEGNKQLMLF